MSTVEKVRAPPPPLVQGTTAALQEPQTTTASPRVQVYARAIARNRLRGNRESRFQIC
eukprot:CAMPEP_0201919740 /NCGR_PEP_ID=MMETSP0903-20130614/8545_1 /ASSEMBLY_ACC=CAM_ASM_000552 /TAXON_ID=420261 /ORGANISM="Thalassiosira antarctica, Strain CCMP982" /LENGTH=57 /DNA_ID=CAMNT_0048456329 /DNA_START=27 /DNA_END=200 /DNA_ORIENTATION=-